MISVAQAQARIAALLPHLPDEEIALADSAGRVLAAPVVAAHNQPPFAASAMDGYATRAADVHPGATLRVVGAAPAGKGWAGRIGPGEAVRIFTGAPMPEGSDKVVIQEQTTRTGQDGATCITLADEITPQPFVRAAGADFTAGFTLTAPRRIGPAQISLIAAMNIPRLRVARRPVVALLATGDELIWPGGTLGPDQIIASNIFGLKALCEAQGAEVRLLPIAPDRPEALAARLEMARDADLIVTIGGASVGDHDLVANCAQELGFARDFYKIAMRPGKPLMAGRLGDAVMIGLPGNPVSALICGQLFVAPAVAALQGLAYAGPQLHRAHLGAALGANGARAHYMRATLADGVCTPAPQQDSALLSLLEQSNVLLVRPPHDPARAKGDPVTYCALFNAS